MLTYWSFSDALIQTYTLPYLKIMLQELPVGSTIHLLTLEKETAVKRTVEDFPAIQHLPYKYIPFGMSAAWDWIKNILKLKTYIRQQRIDYLHAFCTPAGMVGYLLSRITGRPLVLDSYEPHAEAMGENGEWKKTSWAFKILFYFEKKQAQRARYVIAAAEGMQNYARQKYNIHLPKLFIKPACVDLHKFRLEDRKNENLLSALQLDQKIVCVYAGKFGGIYLKEEVFAFYKACYQKWKDDFVALILTSHFPTEIEALASEAGLPAHIFRVKFVPHAHVPAYIGLGDFAITPVKPVPTKRYCTPIKNGEYWAMGLPVVITKNISTDSDLIEQNNIGYVLNELNDAVYAAAVNHIAGLLQNKALPEKIRSIAESHRNFKQCHLIYKTVYAS